jgi:hypothetical protein
MEYCEITRTVDGFGGSAGAYYGPTVLRNCRIHNSYYTAWLNSATSTPYANFPTSPSDRRCHSDGVQIQGFSGYTIEGCYIGGGRAPGITSGNKQTYRDYLNPAHQPTIAAVNAADDYANAAIIIQNNIPAGGPVGAMVEKNWLAGGDAVVNLNGNLGGDTLPNVTLRDNRFIRQSTFGASDGFVIYRSTNCTATITGNVWDDTGAAVPVNTY